MNAFNGFTYLVVALLAVMGLRALHLMIRDYTQRARLNIARQGRLHEKIKVSNWNVGRPPEGVLLLCDFNLMGLEIGRLRTDAPDGHPRIEGQGFSFLLDDLVSWIEIPERSRKADAPGWEAKGGRARP
jgi:hypothetical protein